MRAMIAATSLTAIGCAALAGCSSEPDVKAIPVFSKAALQDDISKRLTEAGQKPESVICKDDLVGEVGKTASCEVVANPANIFEARVIVTSVRDDKINYEMTQALSKEQVEKAVLDRVQTASGVKVDTVTCESGLEGRKGKTTSCEVNSQGAIGRWNVEIADVPGSLMGFLVYPVITQREIEQIFLGRIAQEAGYQPDSVTCSKDLVGKIGATTNCTVVSGDIMETFTLTTTSVEGASIGYGFEQTS